MGQGGGWQDGLSWPSNPLHSSTLVLRTRVMRGWEGPLRTLHPSWNPLHCPSWRISGLRYGHQQGGCASQVCCSRETWRTSALDLYPPGHWSIASVPEMLMAVTLGKACAPPCSMDQLKLLCAHHLCVSLCESVTRSLATTDGLILSVDPKGKNSVLGECEMVCHPGLLGF